MKKNDAAGYSLVEVMVVVLIAVVLAGFTSLSIDVIRRERVRSASRELLADLQRLRYEAMTLDAKGAGIRFESNSAYVLFRFDDCDHDYEYDTDTCEHNGREERDVKRKILPAAVEIKRGNPSTDPNNDILIFDRFGIPRTKTWALGPLKLILKSQSDMDAAKCVVISMNRIREGVLAKDGSGCQVE